MMGADLQQVKDQLGCERPAEMGGFARATSRCHRHDVSILPTGEGELGRCLGSHPAANLSMIRRRTPQQGQGRDSAQA
jgi:hypothetical protein